MTHTCKRNGIGKSRKSVSPSGFTLLELLIVIAIIVILAALLLPALKTVRQKAHATACVSLQRQVGLVFGMYAQDNNEYIPKKKDSTRITTPYYNQHWFGILVETGHLTDATAKKLLRCPEAKRSWSIGMNLYYFYTWRRRVRIGKPSNVYLHGDWYNPTGNEGEIGFNYKDDTTNRHPSFRHGGRGQTGGNGVFGFVDGHVESCRYADFPGITSPSIIKQKLYPK